MLCCETWSEHFRAINDAYPSSVVFMLALAEETANQWVQIGFTFISEFPWGLYDSVTQQAQWQLSFLPETSSNIRIKLP